MCLTPKVSHRSITSFSSPCDFVLNDEILSCFDPAIDELTMSYCEYTDPTTISLLPAEPNTLTIMQLNIRGMVNKQDDLSVLLKTKHIDVVLLCDNWLNENNTSRVNTPGYNFIYCNREKRTGSGVAILVKDCLKFRKWQAFESNEFESVCVELKMNSCNLILSSAYRPPNINASKFVSEFQLFLSSLKSSGKQSIIGMDHNLDFLKHSYHKPTQDFLELLAAQDYLSSITKPTCIMHTSATLIDNIFLKSSISNSISSEILIDNISDHMPCIASIKSEDKCIQSQQFIEKRKINTKVLKKIKSDLSAVNWHDML